MNGNALWMHEEIVLLALEDRKGTFGWKNLSPAVGGAILAELLLNGRISLEEREKDPLVDVLDDEPLGCPVLDEALERVATSSRRARMSQWITRFRTRKKLDRSIARELCRRGILREDEKSVLLLFRKKIYPEVNPTPERRLVERLEKAVFSDTGLDDHMEALVGLAHGADLLRHKIERSRLKKRKRRLDQLRSDNPVAAATHRLMEASQAAVVTTVIISATT